MTKLTPDVLRSLEIGESVIITETRKGTCKGQGDVTHLYVRLKPRRFQTKRLLLVDPKEATAQRVLRITRVDDWP